MSDPSRRTFLASLGAFAVAASVASAQEETPESDADIVPPLQVWNIPEIGEEQRRSYEEYFRIPEMSIGIYKLPAGGVDGQSPHREDEVYYVISGRAKIEVEDEVQPVEEGSLIFVAKQARHKFIDIEEDLTLLVLFAPAAGSSS